MTEMNAITPGDRDRGRELAEVDAQLLGLALDFAWSSWIGDVGHVPDAFDLSPRTAECRAAFEGSAFVSLVARRYAVLAAPVQRGHRWVPDSPEDEGPPEWMCSRTGCAARLTGIADGCVGDLLDPPAPGETAGGGDRS